METFSMFVQSDEFEPEIFPEEIEEVMREIYEKDMRNAPRWEDICE